MRAFLTAALVVSLAACQTTQEASQTAAQTAAPNEYRPSVEAVGEMPQTAADMGFEQKPTEMSCTAIVEALRDQPDKMAQAHFLKIPALLVKTGVGYVTGGGGLIANDPWWEMDRQVVWHVMLSAELSERLVAGTCPRVRVASSGGTE